MKKINVALLSLIALLLLAQFIRPKISNYPITKEIPVPDSVKLVLKRSCYDCHSNQTSLKWFDKITPANFFVASHIRDGRNALNFSQLDSLQPAAQKAILFQAINATRNDQMPLSNYLILHSEARMNNNDIKVIEHYLASISPRKATDSTTLARIQKQYAEANIETKEKKVTPEWNGVEYIDGFENWKVISITDRFDNGTMRIIYGNEIAIKAIEENHINPWPDGSVFAKAAWTAQVDSTGKKATTGEFWQVEFMIKDAVKYASVGGWGWGRWRTPALTPYGKDATFVTECTSCHRQVKENDLVFTYPFHFSK